MGIQATANSVRSCFDLTPEQRAELAQRLAQHVADPASAIPGDEVRRKHVMILRGSRDAVSV
jgi:putative addiction module component (TIGR02574 family)